MTLWSGDWEMDILLRALLFLFFFFFFVICYLFYIFVMLFYDFRLYVILVDRHSKYH
jgi:hypothetical protein